MVEDKKDSDRDRENDLSLPKEELQYDLYFFHPPSANTNTNKTTSGVMNKDGERDRERERLAEILKYSLCLEDERDSADDFEEERDTEREAERKEREKRERDKLETQVREERAGLLSSHQSLSLSVEDLIQIIDILRIILSLKKEKRRERRERMRRDYLSLFSKVLPCPNLLSQSDIHQLEREIGLLRTVILYLVSVSAEKDDERERSGLGQRETERIVSLSMSLSASLSALFASSLPPVLIQSICSLYVYSPSLCLFLSLGLI